MRSAVLYLLMLCCSVGEGRAEVSVPADDGSRTEASPPRDLSVLWEEMQGLKQLVLSLKGEQVEQRQELRTVESRLRDGEMEAKLQKQSMDELQMALDLLLTEQTSGLRKKVEELEEQTKAEISELHARINSSDNSVEILKKKNSAVAAELPFLQTRLRASESSVEQLRRKDTVLAGRLCNTESLMEELMGQLSEIQACNTSAGMDSEVLVLESHLDIHLHKLKADIEGQIHVLENKLSSSLVGLDGLSAAAEHRLNQAERQQDELRNHNTELVSRLESNEKQLGDLRTINTYMETRLNSTEEQLDQLKNQSAVLEFRLRVSERRMEEQQTGNSELVSRLRSREKQLEDQKTTITDMETRLNSTEEQLDQLKNQSAVLEFRLRVSERRLEEQQTGSSAQFSRMESRLTDEQSRTAEFETQLSAVTFRLNVTKELLDDLKNQSLAGAAELASLSERLTAAQGNTEDELKVAFSAGLTDSGIVGPFDEETTLIFSKTITNVGRGYNSSAGVFTAPVTGLYFFSFTAADYLKGYMGLYLYRNEQPVSFSLDLNDHGGYTSMTSAVALQLDRGDRVRLALPASYRLYDDSRNFSMFSGFLLFPV
ncbi:PREDICTED: myosin-2 heavy chain, non muscle-like isoform X1 [Poecilia mexicana]|uniref:myosin-2 heavy chain, non muscle-like isoform X1 n=1 Tax=Poecilia mexicana TaxID=48701 RepID=UPI00072E4596|nr:PREDICTED: myosin-2 heavy chain, non muscle-like isoform X1 [Poecilia mexicana]